MNSMTQNRIDETDVIAPNQRLKYLFSDQEVEDTAQEVKIKLDPIYKFNINEPHFYDTSYINDTTMISNSPIDERSIRVASYNGEIYRKTDTYNGWEIEYNNDDTSYYLNVPIEAVSGEGVDVFVYNTQYYNNTTIEMTTAE